MTRPNDVPEEVWEKAVALGHIVADDSGWLPSDEALHEIARAIQAAEQRGTREGENAKYPDRYVITGLVAEDTHQVGVKKGDRVWLYWSPEGGGWWQWGPEGWARRFEEKAGREFEDALACAPRVGPWYNQPDPATIEAVAVPAIVTVR